MVLLKYFTTTSAVFCFFLHHFHPLPGIWARNSPVLGEACGREGLYYWTQKWLIIQTLGGGNEHQQAVCFNIYPENRNRKEMHITLPSLTGPTSHLHSDQTSEAAKWKRDIDKRGLRKTASKKSPPPPPFFAPLHTTAVRHRKIGVSKFYCQRSKTKTSNSTTVKFHN